MPICWIGREITPVPHKGPTRRVQPVAAAVQVREVRDHIGALPLIDAERRLLGILTTADTLAGLLREAPLELWA